MNSRALNVVLASAFGGGIGSLLANEIIHVLWWVGLLGGLVVGYLSFEWQKVVAAIPVAWRAAKGWRPSPSYGKACKVDMLYGVDLGSWLSLFLSVLLLFICPYQLRTGHWWLVCLLYAHVIGFGLSSLITIKDVLGNVLKNEEYLAYQANHFDELGAKGILGYSAPHVLFVTLPPLLPGLFVATFRFALTFAWKLFLAVFSKARLTSAVAALIGAGVGFLCGSVLAGMASGAVLGLLGHVVILHRWLIPRGYVPAPARID